MTRMEPYVINLGPEVGEIEWHSISDSIKWLAGLEDEWSWLNQRPISLIGNVHPWAQLVSHLNSIKQSLDRAMALQSQANNDGAASNFDSAYAELKELFENQPWLAPHSSRHALIKDVRERKGDRVAGILLALWMKLPISREIDQAAVAQACIEAELFDRGAPPRSEWDSKAYTEILKTLTADRSSYLAALKDAQDHLAQQATTFNDAEKLRSDTFGESQSHRDIQWTAALNSSIEELNNVKEAYDKHMALAAPVEYWQTKQQRHFKWMCASGVLTVAGMVLAGWLLHCELTAVAEKAIASGAATAASGVKQEGAVAVLSAVASWRLGSFILLATLAFWVLRLLVRIFLSNLHLENDAAERVTMVKTYLALIRDGKLAGDGENLKAMLAALFRPTGDGLVRDEGIPPTTLDWFTKLSGK